MLSRQNLLRSSPTTTITRWNYQSTNGSALIYANARRYSLSQHWSASKSKEDPDKLNPRKIAVAMSGGVDSSVVAYLLSKQYPTDELVGVHMSNWDYADEDPDAATTIKSNKNESYCWEQDWKDASAVAKQLNIPLNHVSFQAEYWNDVFQPYCQKLSESITPNPDFDCNRYIKFGALKEYLQIRFQDSEIGYLATGHYARIWDRSRDKTMPTYLEQALKEEESNVLADYILDPSVADQPLLFSAIDRSKDQSYFLSGVSAKAFSGVMFPLGDLYKTEKGKLEEMINADNMNDAVLSVRQVAQEAQLPNASKRDSVGICFIGKRKHGDFINEYVAHPLDNGGSESSSSLVQYIDVETNEPVTNFDPADNPSLLYATIGQGAKISGAGQKWFVVDKRLKEKPPSILICPGTHHPSLYVDKFYVKAKNFNWIPGGDANRPPPLPLRAKCRIRHLQPLVDCEICMAADEGHYQVELKIPLRGVAPGQICVVYAGGTTGDLICLGGGPIDQRGQNYWEMQRDLPSALHPAGHNDSSVARREQTNAK